MADVDAIVVGTGPNGLTAAVVLARAGLRVAVYEAAEGIGGGARTEELTEPGFRHDPCSGVHPLGAGSAAWAGMPLADFGLEWLHGAHPLAHPMADGTAVVVERSAAATAEHLGPDARRYRRLVGPFVDRWADLADDLLRPALSRFPRHPLLDARFGLRALPPARVLARAFDAPGTRALLAGFAAHAMVPLTQTATGAVSVMFAVAAHAGGWPVPRGGSQAISDALAGYLQSLGGTITTGCHVTSLEELPTAHAYLLDVSPSALATIAGPRLPDRYRHRLNRSRLGGAAFKVDWALDEPVPWKNPACRESVSVHLGGSFEEIADALDAVGDDRQPDPPVLITAQPTVVDPSRAPAGKHVLWAWAPVPRGWEGDMTDVIERQIERYAPGFRDVVRARAVAGPPTLAARNPNYIGGDIGGGRFAGLDAVFRPVAARQPYATPDPTVYLCSAATPPGPGVHGMCGYHAARLALRRRFGVRPRGGS
ncbi:MAG: NAD(P)/FAD-dependent oxidoreductase [Acidimicrobiia bacterium]|nr:NAD(P)/FAD-dependent oxidoreductase [Acidimicrobiia bacterium]